RWLQAPGSQDLNAAARHFVNAGIATGFDPSTSILTGINSAANAHPITFYIRNDVSAMLDLGNSLASEICYIFTGSYNVPCTSYLSVVRGPITAMGVFDNSGASVNRNWWMYTSGVGSAVFIPPELGREIPQRDPFDTTLYFSYNSKFSSGGG